MSKVNFPKPPSINPKIYAYIDKGIKGYIKIGYTSIDVEKRVKR